MSIFRGETLNSISHGPDDAEVFSHRCIYTNAIYLYAREASASIGSSVSSCDRAVLMCVTCIRVWSDRRICRQAQRGWESTRVRHDGQKAGKSPGRAVDKCSRRLGDIDLRPRVKSVLNSRSQRQARDGGLGQCCRSQNDGSLGIFSLPLQWTDEPRKHGDQ